MGVNRIQRKHACMFSLVSRRADAGAAGVSVRKAKSAMGVMCKPSAASLNPNLKEPTEFHLGRLFYINHQDFPSILFRMH
ncbi:hypothetical protein B7993_05680 [Fibrobacter sp. UWH3]|nr:hypothetical protein B7993_05680 [Fibrobacter sp. UWH3]